jgi:hypothetical protein
MNWRYELRLGLAVLFRRDRFDSDLEGRLIARPRP